MPDVILSENASPLDTTTSVRPSLRSRVRLSLLGLLLGAAGASLGLMPGLRLLDGGRLPIQNLWAFPTLPADMPFALLPVSQYEATTILAIMLVGGLLPGLAVHVIARRRHFAAWPVALGVLLVQAIAVAQSFTVLKHGLTPVEPSDHSDVADHYFTGMLGGTIISMLLGQAGFWLTSRRKTGPVALGIALTAESFTAWVSAWIREFSGLSTSYTPWTSHLVQWLPIVIVSAALVWCGIRPPRRFGVWVGALLGLWLIPALLTAVASALGSRVLHGDLRAVLIAGREAFVHVAEYNARSAATAATIAVAGLVTLTFIRSSSDEDAGRRWGVMPNGVRSSSPATAPGDPPPEG